MPSHSISKRLAKRTNHKADVKVKRLARYKECVDSLQDTTMNEAMLRLQLPKATIHWRVRTYFKLLDDPPAHSLYMAMRMRQCGLRSCRSTPS